MELNPILSRPGGTKLNAIVEVHLDRILKAVLIFKGMMIEWVVVKGWEEELVKQDTGQPDIWGESRYHVGKIVPQYQSNIITGVPTHHRECQCGNASLSVAYLSRACCQVIHDLPSQVQNTLCQTGDCPHAILKLAVLGACSATSAAAVVAICRTTYHPLGGSSGHWRLSTKTADLERLSAKSNDVPV